MGALVTASKKQPLDQAAFLPCTLGLAFPWWALLVTVGCSWERSTQLQGLTHGRKTKALLEQSPLLPQHRPPSPSVLVPHIPLTLCDDASRCRVRNHPKSTFTKAPWIASRRLLRRKVWLQACTRDLRQIFCAAWVVLWCWCSMTGQRLTWASEVASPQESANL